MARIPKNPAQEEKAVKSADRVLDIFVLLAQYPNGLKLKDIAIKLKIPVSSLHAILNTMKNRDFLERDENSLIFRLSRKINQIIPSISHPEDDLVDLALPVMERVQKECGETVSLSVLAGSDVVFIAKRSSSSIIQVVQSLGSSFPAHSTGSGKVMLAYLPEERLDQLYPEERLARLTNKTLTSKLALKHKLSEIRQLGYAFDEEESVEGVWAAAACIHAQDGSPIAATSIVVPNFRVTEKLTNHLIKRITEAAAEITRKLNIHPSGKAV